MIGGLLILIKSAYIKTLRILKTILLSFFLISISLIAQAQTIERFNSFSYNVNEGLLQSTINDAAFDKNNFMWISFSNGIQKFDGKSFTTVPVQPGLPDDKFVNFFKCSNGDLLFSHSQGISKYQLSDDRFIPVYANKSPVKKPAAFVGQDEDVIYFYTAAGDITGINSLTFTIISETQTGLPSYPSGGQYPFRFSDNIINHRVGININYKLYLWDLKQQRLLGISAAIPDLSAYLLYLKTANEILYYKYPKNNALQLYNFSTQKNSLLFVKGKDERQISRSIIYPWQNKLLLSFNNQLFETDTSLQVLKSEMVNFQNQPIAGALGIARIKEDNFGNLYLLTINGGIKKIIRNNYPVKYYGTAEKENNFIISLLPDKKNNRILAGTSGNGLLIFDTLQRLIKHIKTLPGHKQPFSPGTIIKNNKGDYLLFNAGEKMVWILKNDFSEMTPVPITTFLPANKTGISYFGKTLFQNESEAIIQSQGKLYRTSFISNTVTEHEISTSYIMSGLFHNNSIITHGNDELIFLDAATFKEIKKIPFKNTGNVRCFSKDAANDIYVGSNKGIFKIDSTGKIVLHLTKESGLPDECIYAMVFDDEGFLWCSTNKGIFKVNKDNSIFQLTKDDGLQENEFNTNAVAKSEDGEIFFGGVNGVSSFYPSAMNSFEEKINLLFTRIRLNNEDAFKDSAVWNIREMDLSHNQNSLSFDFIAMANNNPGQYIYQYRMAGVDKQWIQNNGLQTVRYFLPPGNYVFQAYASRFFNKEAKPMKEIHIAIHQPFWKTWWFFTSLAVLFIAMMAYAINQYNRRKYRKKLTELENEHKIQLERERISRDLHDSIGAYANAVLYNTELLQKEDGISERNNLMNDLKFASKDIITSLRENIWALKKDNYTAEECLLRIKNFIHPFSRYYPHIQFKVEGEASAQKQLHYTRALNVVRIVQEAVTNAIKHTTAGTISIVSNEKDGKWDLTVADDGKGFSYEAMKKAEQGNGLNNMKQRAIDSGFDITIESIDGTGTKISILI